MMRNASGAAGFGYEITLMRRYMTLAGEGCRLGRRVSRPTRRRSPRSPRSRSASTRARPCTTAGSPRRPDLTARRRSAGVGEQPAGALRRRHAEVAVRRQRRDPAARRALQEALLDQEGLDHVLDRVALLADRGGEVVQARPGRRRSWWITASSSLRSITSRPCGSTSSIASAASATGARDRAVALAPRRSRARGAAAGWRCAACRASGARSRSAPSASIGDR